MEFAPLHFANAQPLIDNGLEPSVSRVTVVVSTADPFVIDGQSVDAFVAGPQFQPLRIEYPQDGSCLEWTFSIFEAENVFGLHPKELCNQVVALTDIPRSDNAKRAIDCLTLRTSPCVADKHIVARFAWDEMQTGSITKLDELSARLGLTLRRLEQVFQDTFGASPKQVQSLLRYERACNICQQGSADLAKTALFAGYSDQSHMTRDFRRFAGLTPAQMRSALQGSK